MTKKKQLEFHPHRECAKAHLVQYTGDPLLAECGDEVYVASTTTTCPFFVQRMRPAEVEHRKKRLGITDKYI